MSHRREQVASTLKRLISHVLATQMSDPRIAGLVSITRVEISEDMHHATVFVSVLPEKYEKRTIAGLQSGAKHIGLEVRKRVTLRLMPRLSFRLDQDLKKQAEIEHAISRGLETSGPAPESDDLEVDVDDVNDVDVDEAMESQDVDATADLSDQDLDLPATDGDVRS